MHGSIMIYLFAVPFAFGLANYIVPLQIGAPDMAFPRLNALGYWLYLFGGITMISGFLTAGGSASFGWFAYAPLSGAVYSPGVGRRPVDRRRRGHEHRRRAHRGEHRDDDLHVARTGHDDVPHADLHVEHAGDERARAAGVPGAHRRAGDAVLATATSIRTSSRRRRRHADSLAAHVLVLRSSRGVHHRLAVLRGRHRGVRGVLAPPGVRLQEPRLRDARDRRPVRRRVGAPHVRDRGGRCCRSSP